MLEDRFAVPSIRATGFALLIGALAVVVCYLTVDRPVSHFVHDHHLSRLQVFQWLTLPPPILQAWSPAILIFCLILRAMRPACRAALVAIAACVGLVVADQFKESMALVFGRSWPETWIDNNPSLIGDGTFDFHWLHGSPKYASFPSGHMARVGAAVAAYWIAYPRLKILYILVMLATAAGLLGMNYHFVGDILGGTCVGGIVGAYTSYACGLHSVRDPTSRAVE